MGLDCERRISKSEESRICQGLNVQVQTFLGRQLGLCRYPYVNRDTTYLQGRDQTRLQVISRAVFMEVGITASGLREVFGIEGGVQLVISKGEAFPGMVAHAGLKQAIARCFQGNS